MRSWNPLEIEKGFLLSISFPFFYCEKKINKNKVIKVVNVKKRHRFLEWDSNMVPNNLTIA